MAYFVAFCCNFTSSINPEIRRSGIWMCLNLDIYKSVSLSIFFSKDSEFFLWERRKINQDDDQLFANKLVKFK